MNVASGSNEGLSGDVPNRHLPRPRLRELRTGRRGERLRWLSWAAVPLLVAALLGCEAVGAEGLDADAADAGDLADTRVHADGTDASLDASTEDAGTDAIGPNPAVGFDVDYTDPVALGAWMRDASYRAWDFDSDVLPIEATGGSRRIFWNDALATSMAREAPRHPVGSVGVRENFHPDGALSSFSILIRVSESSGPDGWLYYELFDPVENDTPLVHEAGAAGCVGCHARSMTDFVFEPDADPFVACRPSP